MIMSMPKDGEGTRANTLFNLAKVCTGAGLLSLPNAVQRAGVPMGFFIIASVCTLNAFAVHIMIGCKELIPSRVLVPGQDTYSQVARYTFGKPGVILVQCCLVGTLIGATCVYMISVGDMMNQVFPQISRLEFMFLSTLFLLPFSQARKLSFLSWVSIAGVFAYIGAILAILWYGGMHYRLQYNWTVMSVGSFNDISNCVGVTAFGLGLPVVAFQLQESMKHPSAFLSLVNMSLVAVFVSFGTVGTLGCGFFSLSSPTGALPNIIDNLGGGVASDIVKALVSLTLLLTQPLCLVCALNVLESAVSSLRASVTATDGETSPLAGGQATETYGASDSGGLRFGSPILRKSGDVVFRFMLVGVVFLLAWAVPCFSLVMSFIGCFTISILSFILPSIFFLKLLSMGHDSPQPEFYRAQLTRFNYPRWGRELRYGCYVLTAFGVFIASLCVPIISNGSCQ